MVFTSSSSVCGNTETLPKREDMLPDPIVTNAGLEGTEVAIIPLFPVTPLTNCQPVRQARVYWLNGHF